MVQFYEEFGVFYGLAPRALEFLETYWKMKSFLETFIWGEVL